MPALNLRSAGKKVAVTMHYNHPLFDLLTVLCFESGQQPLEHNEIN
jgi:hypothetical protein